MIDPDLVIGNDVSMDEVGSEARLQEIASQFSELEYVEAVVLAGSATGGTSDSQSDYDLYVYSRHPVPSCVPEARPSESQPPSGRVAFQLLRLPSDAF
jgi:predicted nucleotidyltransferase